MELNKFEKDIKEKLEKRTLQPSKDAWGKLSGRLDVLDKKKDDRSYWWIGIAASIVGILFIALQFLNDTTTVKGTPEIVITPEIIQEKNDNQITLEEEDKVFNTKRRDAKNVIKHIDDKKDVINPKVVSVIKNDSSKDVATVSSKAKINKEKTDVIIKPNKLLKEALTFEEQKVQDIVAQVKVLKEHNKNVTDAEIDALLEQAQKEIHFHRLYDETTGVVDANALLQDVEADLDQSFRVKVFKAIKASYGSLKTTVAQRNN